LTAAPPTAAPPTAAATKRSETVEGLLEREVFAGEGFKVAWIKPSTGKRMQVVLRGESALMRTGMRVQLWGKWAVNPKYGSQFEARTAKLFMPDTEADIASLIAGCIAGVGPVMARRIVDRFGVAALVVARDEPRKLLQVAGVRQTTLDSFGDFFRQQDDNKGSDDGGGAAVAKPSNKPNPMIVAHFQNVGFSALLARRIEETYRKAGMDAFTAVGSRPDGLYDLANMVRSLGFVKVDALALRNGVARDSPQRARAAVMYALESACEQQGHTVVLEKTLRASAARALEPIAVGHQEAVLLNANVNSALDALHAAGQAVRVDGTWQSKKLLDFETFLATRLWRLRNAPPLRPVDVTAVDAIVASTDASLTAQQRAAVRDALVHKLVVINGGPGVGKTQTVSAIVHAARTAGLRAICLGAPTGKAARRLQEASKHEAYTLHQLLAMRDGAGLLRGRRADALLDLMVIDETSMVSIELLALVLQQLNPEARLVLVGDADQLPSIAPGAVLRDVLESGVAKVHSLNEVFRQAASSAIVQRAHALIRGEWGPAQSCSENDFEVIECVDPNEAAERVVDLVANDLRARFDGAIAQVLCPMHMGALGVTNLNRMLQHKLNPPRGGNDDDLTVSGAVYRVGDRIVQLKNDYQRAIRNGDVGRVVRVNAHGHKSVLWAEFDDAGLVEFDRDEMVDVALAYALTIHKSQGSEFPVVVLAISLVHYAMLKRNLVYTAITRGKRHVAVVGASAAFATAVRRNDIAERRTTLANRLARLADGDSGNGDNVKSIAA